LIYIAGSRATPWFRLDEVAFQLVHEKSCVIKSTSRYFEWTNNAFVYFVGFSPKI